MDARSASERAPGSEEDAYSDRAKAGELAGRIMAGDRSAEDELVRTYERPVRFILRRQFWGAGFIDDALQDAFIRVILRLRSGDIDNPDSLTAFLRQTAIYIGFEYLRDERRHASALDPDLLPIIPDLSADLFGQLEKEDLVRYVRQVIDELSVKRDREILVRFYYRGHSKKHICRDYEDLTTEHFDKVIHRARKRLKDLIEQKEQPGPPAETRATDQADTSRQSTGSGDDRQEGPLKLLGALISPWLTILRPPPMAYSGIAP